MGLISSYLITTKNLEGVFNSIITAKAPEAFTQRFLDNLGFKSTNDRLYIGLFKGLGFLDEVGVPTQRYFEFLDQSQSKKVLAEAIRDAYGDLFAININAHELSVDDVKSKIRRLTQGKNSTNVDKFMANTFRALVDYAEWGEDVQNQKMNDKDGELVKNDKHEDESVNNGGKPEEQEPNNLHKSINNLNQAQLHYNIQIHLPESRDSAVYEALFKALREHLL